MYHPSLTLAVIQTPPPLLSQADFRWEPEVRIKVGAALLALLLENSHLPDGIAGRRPKTWTPNTTAASSSTAATAAAAAAAAFEYTYVKSGLKQQAYVCASEGLVRVLLVDRSIAAALLVKVPPMLVPPLPWSGYCTGGQLTSRWGLREGEGCGGGGRWVGGAGGVGGQCCVCGRWGG